MPDASQDLIATAVRELEDTRGIVVAGPPPATD